MKKDGEAFVGIDTAKARNAVAVAEGGRGGEIRYLGEFDNTPAAVNKLVRKMADRYLSGCGALLGSGGPGYSGVR